jgi:hypothetical protein
LITVQVPLLLNAMGLKLLVVIDADASARMARRCVVRLGPEAVIPFCDSSAAFVDCSAEFAVSETAPT